MLRDSTVAPFTFISSPQPAQTGDHYIEHQPVQQSLTDELRTPARVQVGLYLRSQAIAEAFAFTLSAHGHSTQVLEHLPAPGQWLVPRFDLIVTAPELFTAENRHQLDRVRDLKCPIVFLASEAKCSYLELAIKVRACGFLTNRLPLHEIVSSLEQLLSGELREIWCPEAEQMIERRPGNRRVVQNSLLSLLTPRQLEVLAFLAEGKSVKEVAQVMHLSQKSVDSHKYRIMNRLNIHDRVQLSRLAIREGLIEA